MQYTELTLTVPEDFRTKLEEQAQKQYMTAEGLASCWLANQLCNAIEGPMRVQGKPDLFLAVLNKAMPAVLRAVEEEMLGGARKTTGPASYSEQVQKVCAMLDQVIERGPLEDHQKGKLRDRVQNLRADLDAMLAH